MFPPSAFANYNLTPARFISKFFRKDISKNKLKLVYILRDRSKNIDSKAFFPNQRSVTKGIVLRSILHRLMCYLFPRSFVYPRSVMF